MLKELRLKNFKSFSDEQTIPFAPVTVFVGANGSGKSNALDALRFLKWLHQGLELIHVLDRHPEDRERDFSGVRGGSTGIAWNDREPVEIASTVEINSSQAPSPLMLWHKVCFDTLTSMMDKPSIRKEIIKRIELDGEAVLLHATRNGDIGSPIVEFRNAHAHLGFDVADFARSTLRLADFDDVFETEELNATKLDAKEWKAILQEEKARIEESRHIIHRYRQSWDDVRFLDLRPSDMREYADARQTELGITGRNLSAVLARICEDSDRKQTLLGWISALCVPEITDIGFVKTELGDVIFQLVEGAGHNRKVSARNASDGTLRFLALLAAMFSASEGSVLVLEEIENGLHPNRVHLLVELFEQFAEYRDIQIIATTHSPRVLLALSEDARRRAVLFARNDEDQAGTIVKRLGDLPYFDEVAGKAGIDELFATGWLEFAV